MKKLALIIATTLMISCTAHYTCPTYMQNESVTNGALAQNCIDIIKTATPEKKHKVSAVIYIYCENDCADSLKIKNDTIPL